MLARGTSAKSMYTISMTIAQYERDIEMRDFSSTIGFAKHHGTILHEYIGVLMVQQGWTGD